MGLAGLEMLPILEAEVDGEDPLTLDEALAAGLVEISEVSEAGRVPELKFVNRAARPVLLLDGEELVGAKQNRILNLSILAPAGAELVIPVSCVEAGRWTWRTRRFAAADRAWFAKARARKMREVYWSLKTSGKPMASQRNVWEEIDARAARLKVDHGATQASAELYWTYEEQMAAWLAALAPQAGQAGAIFLVHGEVAGLELFRSPALFAKLAPKLIRSYAMDALDPAEERLSPPAAFSAAARSASRLLDRLGSCAGESFPSVGLGTDLRLTAHELLGAALVAEEAIIHLSAFPSSALAD